MNIMHNPPHPGEVLREWLAEITVTDAAKRLGVTRVALSRVLNGAAGISAENEDVNRLDERLLESVHEHSPLEKIHLQVHEVA